MAEGIAHGEPPTFYANVVTASVDPDVVYLELRRYITPHRDMYRMTQPAGEVPAISGEAVYAIDPVARVVLTYTAARLLQQNLNDLIPKMVSARRGSEQ